jgi:hypothetical protein
MRSLDDLLPSWEGGAAWRELCGGAAVGLVCLGMIVLGEALRWWKVPLLSTPILLFLGLAISVSPIYLVTWRLPAGSDGAAWRCLPLP